MDNGIKHITELKIDIYVLNKDSLGQEAVEIENHLKNCQECNDIYNDLVSFYNRANNAIRVNVKHTDIQNILQLRRNKEQLNIKNIFGNKKYPLFEIIKIKLKELSWSKTTPALKWSLSGAAAIIIFALIYLNYFYPSQEIVNEQNPPKNNEKSITSDNKQTEVLKIDTMSKGNNEIEEQNKKEDKIKKEKKPVERIRNGQILYGVASHLFVSGIKGNYDEFGFIKVVDNTKNAPVLFVFEKDSYSKNVNPGELINSKRDKYRILFNRFPSNGKMNTICSIEPGKDGLMIATSESGKCDDISYEVYYQFDSEFNLKDVEFSKEFISANGKDIEGTDNEKSLILKDLLKKRVKYWDGTSYINYVSEEK